MAHSKTLRDLLAKRGILFGGAVQSEHLKKNQDYQKLISKEFSLLIPENDLKWKWLHKNKDEFDFYGSDTDIKFAVDNNMKITGHVLSWGQDIPDWLKNGQFSNIEARKILENHISAVAGRYKDKIYSWDVVNEVIDWDYNYLDSYWKEKLGSDFVEYPFRVAHKIDPKAKLFYNDWGTEEINSRSDFMYKIISDLLDKDVPIHGVGFQMHIGLAIAPENSGPPNYDKMHKNFERFAKLGLELHISEMDVETNMTNLPYEEKMQKQADIYKGVLEVALDFPNFKSFSTWGITDKINHISWRTGINDFPLLFDENYKPKNSYFALQELLKE